MTERQKKILFFILCTVFLQFFFIINMNGVIYLSDLTMSFVIQKYRSIIPRKHGFTIIHPERFKKYKKVYVNQPAGLLHCGHMLLYEAPLDITVAQLADMTLKYTHYFKRYQLEKALREYNGLRNGEPVRKGTVVYIPHSLPPLVFDVLKETRPALIYTRGLYYTGSSAGNTRFFNLIDGYARKGINTVVFDAKDITGIVNYRSHTPQVQELDTHEKRCIDDIDKFIRGLKERGIFTIARISVFQDHLLYRKRPDLAIQSRTTGKPWQGAGNEFWCDPTNRAVQDYNIALAIELAEKGIDEIQFDYLRFPTGGNLSDARFVYSFGRTSNEEVIAHFLKRAYGEIARRNTLLSIDIFGVVAWGKRPDIRNTGQNIERLARYCDIISPMLYPSHFNDEFDGFENPGDHPYYFISEGCRKVAALAKGTPVRPWLQAFRWRTSSYDENYILQQIKAAHDTGTKGYLFWNASNNYEVVGRALVEMNRKAREEKQQR